MNPTISDKMYMAIGKQTDGKTPVTPDIFLPLMEEDLKTELNAERVPQIVGIDWISDLILQGKREHAGSIKAMAYPDTLGYFLSMTMDKTATVDADPKFTHDFEIGDAEYYTIEVLRNHAAFRYFGVKGNKLEFDFEENNLSMNLEVMSEGSFEVATVKTALTGSVTTIDLTEDYDPRPARGLVIGDTLQVYNVSTDTTYDAVITAVASDFKSVDVTSVAIEAPSGSAVWIKAQTPSHDDLARPFKFGQATFGFGEDLTAAKTAALSCATSAKVDEFKITIDRKLITRHANCDNDPFLLNGSPDAELTVKKLMLDPEAQRQYLGLLKKAVSIVFTGDLIEGTDYNKLTLDFNKVIPRENADKLNKEDYVYDETEYHVEYDKGDSQAMAIELVNENDGTNY